MPNPTDIALDLRGVVKRFGATTALDHVDLDVATGEILAILGPSGCGKSTLLRVVAGLDIPDVGTVRWRGSDITRLPAHRRNFGLMFQGYALFPHRTVAQNVEFGLRMRGMTLDDRRRRTAEALRWVGLEAFGDRKVDGLSGGEQQRVALARTLAPEPGLVMLDEPLGALDRRLRERLVGEIDHLLQERGATAVYVTHDHDEAATVADRVAIMRAGRILQVGAYDEIRANPADPWVADFLV